MYEIIERLSNLMVLADPKPKHFLCLPTTVADVFKNFMLPFKKCPSYVLDKELFTTNIFATIALELWAT